MLPDSEKCPNHSPTKATSETEEEDTVLKLHMEDCVEKIVQIAKNKSNEDLIAILNDNDEIIDVVGEWNHVTENPPDLNHDNEFSPFTETTPKKKDENHDIDSPSEQCEVDQGGTSSSECPIVQNISVDNIQKALMNSKTGPDTTCTNNYKYYQNFHDDQFVEDEDYILRCSDDSDNECSPVTKTTPKRKDENNDMNSPSEQCEVFQGGTSSSECPIVQNISVDNVQKAPMDSKTNSADASCASDYEYCQRLYDYEYNEDKDYSSRLSDDSEDGSSIIIYEINSSSIEKVEQPEFRNPAAIVNPADPCLAKTLEIKVLLKRLPIPVVKAKMPIEVKCSKAGFIKMAPPDGRKFFFIRKKQKPLSLYKKKKQVIFKGKFYFSNLKRIKGRLQCSFNECTFSADNWKVMYNHTKFRHLKNSKCKTNSGMNSHRNKRKDIPKDVDKLDMRVQIILEKFPTKIISLKTPIPITQWLPHSITNTSLSNYQFVHLPSLYKRKVISSSTKKFRCAIEKCMFITNNCRIMHLHVKLCHIPMYRRWNKSLEDVRRQMKIGKN